MHSYFTFRSHYFLLAALLFSLPAISNAEKDSLDSVLKKYYTAMGGLPRLKNVQSIVFSAKIFSKDKQIGTLKVVKKSPNLVRRSISLNDGTETILAYDGSTVWAEFIKGYYHNCKIVSDDNDARPFIRDASIGGPLVDQPDAFKLTYHGLISLEDSGVKCHHIEVVYTDGWTTVDYYIDASEFVERKYVTTEKANGAWSKTEYIPSDYRWVDGVLFAYKIIQRAQDNESSVIIVDDIRLNDGVFDMIFKMPDAPKS